MFDKAKTLPWPGDPLELVFLLVWKMRQQVEFQKERATLQALMAQKGAEGKQIESVFEDLKEAFFPYDKNERKADDKKMREAMYSEISRGPLELTAMSDPNKRKVDHRLQRGTADLQKKSDLQKTGNLMTLDDAFEKARRRGRGVSSI